MDTAKQKEYLVNVLNKKLIESDEYDNSGPVNGGPWGYRKLAKKYWPEEFKNKKRVEVHHIDGDRTNNKVSNLVPLSPAEHRLIHKLFDENFEEHKKNISDGMKGHKVSETTRQRMSQAAYKRWEKYRNSNCAH